MFMSLEPLTGLRVVDLFAGSGALGIEALSRGAAWVDFAERRGPALPALRRNLAALRLEGSTRVWTLSLPQGLKALRGALREADLVLMDPPYGDPLAAECLEELGRPHVLLPDALVVVEHHAKDGLPANAGALRSTRTRQYGETAVTTYVAVRPEGGSDAG
jgi:16S rRNA (guanine966-N2)-methyltransferase